MRKYPTNELELTKPPAKPLHTPEELARLGAAAFDRHVRPVLRPEDDGKFVASDVGTGDNEINDDDYTTVEDALRPTRKR